MKQFALLLLPLLGACTPSAAPYPQRPIARAAERPTPLLPAELMEAGESMAALTLSLRCDVNSPTAQFAQELLRDDAVRRHGLAAQSLISDYAEVRADRYFAGGDKVGRCNDALPWIGRVNAVVLPLARTGPSVHAPRKLEQERAGRR